MSQHEFEHLVEYSIRELATSGEPQQRLRSLYFNLFEYQNLFDTGFTHFRTMNELLAQRFVYRMPLEQHPDFFAYGIYFSEVKAVDSSRASVFVRVPGQERDGSYYRAPHLYFDAGSALWQRLVKLGRLTGADAEAPETIDIATIALEVAHLAEQRDNPELIGMWYRLLMPYGWQFEFDELRANATLAELRAIVKRTDALSYKVNYGMLRDPPPEALKKSPELAWWFDLDAASDRSLLH
jgi:hypothetical protein